MYFTMLVVIMCAGLLSFKAVKISVVEGQRWSAKGDSLYLKYFPVHAERGDILARDGRLLATSLPVFEVRMDLRASGLTDDVFRSNVDSLAYFLSQYANRGWSQRRYRDYLIKRRARNDRYLLIRRNVDYNTLEKFKRFPIFRRGRNAGGFIVEQKNVRDRPYEMLAERTIGYVREGVQPVGLEGYFDNYLHGQDGQRLMKRIDHGNLWIPVEDLHHIDAVRGANLVTTLDIDIQDITQNALLKAVKKHNALYGTAIVMEVRTGAIRAIANITASEGRWVEDYNYAIGAATEPGSTFKLASVMALLEDGYADLDHGIDLNKGYARFYNRDMYDSSMHGLDSTDLRQAFEISSNVGIAKIIQKTYGNTRRADEFIARLRQFGLDRTTGIEIPGEGQPWIKEAYNTEQRWSGVSLPWMSTGYELHLTPLQLLNFYNAVANDGTMMKPYLAESITRDERKIRKFSPEVVIANIASRRTIRLAQELLQGVMERGTGKDMQSDIVTIAGKTGTAVVDYYRPEQARKKYQGSFVGYFPADEPQYSCIVMIYDPKQGGYYGSAVALPAFREIAEGITALTPAQPKRDDHDRSGPRFPEVRFAYATDIEEIGRALDIGYRKTTEGEWVHAVQAEQKDEVILASHPAVDSELPDLRGMGLRDAVFMLENAGLEVTPEGTGRVISQSIRAGTKVSKGTRITLVLG